MKGSEMTEETLFKEMPAFPLVVNEDWQEIHPGMTLLDWFAGQALSAFEFDMTKNSRCDHYAMEAYAYAQAMMKRREELGVGK